MVGRERKGGGGDGKPTLNINAVLVDWWWLSRWWWWWWRWCSFTSI